MAIGFPTIESNPDFYTRLRLEGKGLFDKQFIYPSSFVFNGTLSNITTNGGLDNVYMGQIQKFPGKAWWIESLDTWTSKSILINIVIQNSSSGGIRSFKYQTVLPSGRNVIPVKQWLSGNETITFSSVNGVDNTDKLVFTATPIAVEVTDSLNWNAKKLIVNIGDSITECTNIGTLGTVLSEDTWTRKVWQRYINKGEDVRYVNLAQAGQTASQAEQCRLSGYYSVIKDASLVTYMEGINDVGGNSTATQLMQDTYTSNLSNFIDYFIAQNKTGKLVIMAPTPVEGTTKHAVVEVYRSIAQSVTNNKANSRVLFINMANCFNRTDRSFYYSAEPANNAVHPGIIGNQAMFDYLNTQILTPFINNL